MRSFQIFDVFNNAKIRGGKMQMIPDRLLIIGKTESYLTESVVRQKPKYVNRNNFDDITPKVGLVVN